MEELRKQRRGLRFRLTGLEKRVLSDENCIHTTVHVEALESLWLQIEKLHSEMVYKTDEENLEKLFEEFMIDENRVLDLKSKLKETKINEPTSPAERGAEIRLPALDLSIFGGDIAEWWTFSDLFQAAVHDSLSLSEGQKLQYLKNALRVEALRVIGHLPITNQNYNEAWDLLRQRYENKRQIANTLVQRILSLPNTQPQNLRTTLDNFYEADRALKSVVPEEKRWELMVINLISNSLDSGTLQAWELSLHHTNLPVISQFLEFLEVRARAIQPTKTISKNQPGGSSMPISKCFICKGQHLTKQCSKFLGAAIEERRAIVRKHNLCSNCLAYDHRVLQCNSSNCRKCQRKHHTMLHEDTTSAPGTSLATWSKNTEILLPTVTVEIAQNGNHHHHLRAILDSGSQVNMISAKTVKNLHLQKQKSPYIAQTLAGKCKLPDSVTLNIVKNNWSQPVKFYSAENMDITLPSRRINFQSWDHIQGLNLADPSFHTPGKIDLILGAEVCSILLKGEIRKGKTDQPIAQDTLLGWTVSGATNQPSSSPVNLFCTVNNTLRKFWELEETPNKEPFTEEEAKAEALYSDTTTRQKNGVYEVAYPFSQFPPPLGTSREQAISRFLTLESHLRRKNIWNEYKEVIQEYEQLGHMQPVTREDQNQPAYYLPHHGVYKDSTTTKLRVVFDASAKTSNGNSLNDTMLNGPKMQDDLFYILLRFQIHPIAICADIEKMYRQIVVHPKQQNLQRIIWRNLPHEKLKEFKLTTVTFGMKAAPYLATKTLKQLASDEGDKFPAARLSVEQDFYVDDLLTGASSTVSAVQLCNELHKLLKAGGFNLRKWCSNEPSVIQEMSHKTQEENFTIAAEEGTVSTLGIQWNPAKDVFLFKVQLPPRKNYTKRNLLSDACRIFDPLGWLAPVTINAKIMFQNLWRTPTTWDQELPPEILHKWKKYREDLCLVQNVEIPRHLKHHDSARLTLCGFCDASEKAYGAVIYLRAECKDFIETKLLVAKSKVAPLKIVTIPRLELCAAVLLTWLVKETKAALRKNIPTMLWSDSSVVLHWISQHPSGWKTFVSSSCGNSGTYGAEPLVSCFYNRKSSRLNFKRNRS